MSFAMQSLEDHIAVDILHHAGDLAVPDLVEMGKARSHGLPCHLVGAVIDTEGSHPIAFFHERVDLGFVTDPLGAKSLKDTSDNGVRSDIGAGIGKTLGLGPGRIRSQSRKQIAAIVF
jgi:hypothetical protein